MARKLVKREGAWKSLDGSGQEQCKTALLGLFQREADEEVQRKLGDALAAVAGEQLQYAQEWPELLQAVFTTGGLSGIRLLAAAPELVQERAQLGDVAQFLGAALMQREGRARLEAMRALVSVLWGIEEGDKRAGAFQAIVDGLPGLLAELPEEEPEDLLFCIVELLQVQPRMFRGAVCGLAQAALALATDSEGDEDVRKGALELVLSLAEEVKGFRKDAGLLQATVHGLLGMVAQVDADEAAWCARDYHEADDEEAELLSLYAEEGLDRLSMALGAALLPAFFGAVPGMLQSSEWQHRWAGLRALASVAEGCTDELEDQLGAVLGLVWPCFGSASPRVQFAACHALGQLCTDFGGALQERFAGEALSALVGVLVASGQPRVQTHAAAALVNFSEGVEPAVLEGCLDELLGRLVALLSSPVPSLQAQLMSTIAAFSSAAGASFARYYGGIVPLLYGCVAQSGPEQRKLQCSALEALTLVFLAVGYEQVQPADLRGLVDVMSRLAAAELAADDPMAGYIDAAWVRLCQMMGTHFAPLLPTILPRTLALAAADADLVALDADAPLDEYDEAEWEFGMVKGQRIGLRTSSLETKLDAVERLALYIETLQALFLPYAAQTLEVLLPLLGFGLDENVQAAAAAGLAHLLAVLHQAGAAEAAPWVARVVDELLKALLPKHFSATYAFGALDALADTVAIPGLDLGGDFVRRAAELLPGLLRKLLAEIAERLKGARDEDDDEDADGAQGCEDEEGVLYALSRFAAALFRAYGPPALALNGPLIEFACKTAAGREPSGAMRHAALCILDDAVRYSAGQLPAEWVEPIARALAHGARDGDTDVRQAAVFGLGMCAEHGGPAFRPFLEATGAGLLAGLLRAGNARAPSQDEVTDNAVSATGRLLTALPHLAQPALLDAWLRVFPVLHDAEEMGPAYQALVLMVTTGRITDPAAIREAVAPVLQHKDLADDVRAQLLRILH